MNYYSVINQYRIRVIVLLFLIDKKYLLSNIFAAALDDYTNYHTTNC